VPVHTRKRPGGKPSGPTFVLPGKVDRKTRAKIGRLIDAELAELAGKPKTPHLYRFRFQLVPLCWMAGALAGLAAHQAHRLLPAAVAAAAAVIGAVAVTRHRKPWVRWMVQTSVAWAACWALTFAVVGLGPWGGLWELGWAIPAAVWVERYRWRGPAAEPAGPGAVERTWAELAEAQKWSARLGPPVTIPAGVRYPIICSGAKTPVGKITGQPDAVAAAYDGTITTVFAEPREDGVRSRGWLTLLTSNTLETTRPWNGAGLDPDTGLAVVGRFPEGGDAHERWFVPGVGGGTRHTILSGADGSGKTGKLDMGLCISALSGLVCPVVLDPQMGQALPAWRDFVPYACGVDECMTYLRGLYAAMMARSDYLASLTWTHPRTGKRRKGMGWFDPHITGLPIIEIIIDEAPILLAVKGAAELITNLAKLGRKVGFRLVLAAQVPSLAELKAAELRSILVGGNAFAFRSGDKVSGGMMNITGRPNELPKYFTDGTPTRGLCFADTIEARPGVTMRTDYIEEDRLYSFAETAVHRTWDELVGGCMHHAIERAAERMTNLAAAVTSEAQRELAVLGVLTRPMALGELIVGCDGLAVSEVVAAVTGLEHDGRVHRDGDMLVPA
jgi:hypothetical protein